LQGMKVMYHTKSKLRIQNVTQFNAANDEADDLNAVHLTGRNFQLNTNYPITQLDTLAEFYERSRDNGVILTGGSVLNSATADQSWIEVPNQGAFATCYRASKINLAPGKIKSDVIEFKRTLGLLEYLRSTVSQYRTVSNENRGKCNLIALEKLIGFGSNPIRVYYEKEQWTGVMVRESKSKTMIQDAINNAQSYPPAAPPP